MFRVLDEIAGYLHIWPFDTEEQANAYIAGLVSDPKGYRVVFDLKEGI